eukprot:443992-Rhodomonas_salina.1
MPPLRAERVYTSQPCTPGIHRINFSTEPGTANAQKLGNKGKGLLPRCRQSPLQSTLQLLPFP